MAPVLGKPFIDFKLRSLAQMGVSRAFLLVGQGSDQIVEHVGDGVKYRLEIEYVHDGPTLLGTAGAIRSALDLLPERFWVTYADTLVRADLSAAERVLDQPGVLAVMTVLKNEDQWDTSNVDVEDHKVACYEKNATAGSHHWIDYGLLCFQRDAFATVELGKPSDLRSVLNPIVTAQGLYAWPVSERFWEIGSPAALRATEAHFSAVDMWSQLA
jgi:NDP-sugar pyrophosphorylase family protein